MIAASLAARWLLLLLPHTYAASKNTLLLHLLLAHAGNEVEETLCVVDAQTQEAASKKQVVEGEEAMASHKAAAAKAIKARDGGALRCGCMVLAVWLAVLSAACAQACPLQCTATDAQTLWCMLACAGRV